MDIRVSAAAKDRDTRSHVEEIENLVTPGDIITSDSGFMRYAPRNFFNLIMVIGLQKFKRFLK